jgi:hypothetical protein
MAQDQDKPAGGGNKPKPTGGGQSAKDKSRAQSRPVGAKAPVGKSGKATGATKSVKGGNTPRPGGRAAPAPAPRKLSGAMMAWGAVGLVVVIVAVLVIVKVSSGSSTSTTDYTPVTAAPASVVTDVTTIPASVYNAVGITYPSVAAPTSQPIVLKNQAPLSLGGKSPAMFYYGAEYCPYCAAERWAITAALARFGTWSNLKITASSHTDVYPITHTFSYHGTTFSSPYLTFASVEQYSNVPVAAGGYTNLEQPTKEEQAVLTKFSTPTYIPGATAGQVSFPFVNIGNVALISGASYNPGILASLSWSDIAGGLNDPTNPVTQSIVATANYMTAAICVSTKGNPGSVCKSSGVEAAAKALKLS